MKRVSGQFQRKNEWVLRCMVNENNGLNITPLYIFMAQPALPLDLMRSRYIIWKRNKKDIKTREKEKKCAVWHPIIWD